MVFVILSILSLAIGVAAAVFVVLFLFQAFDAKRPKPRLAVIFAYLCICGLFLALASFLSGLIPQG